MVLVLNIRFFLITMLEFLETVRKLFGYRTENSNDITPRKRRLSRDNDFVQTKMRRLDDFAMPRCSSPFDDLELPSSSKNLFKKPVSTKQYLKPTEVIDLSDDDDIDLKNKDSDTENDSWVNARKLKSDFLKTYSLSRSNYLPRTIKSREDKVKNHLSVLRKAKNTLTNCNNFISANSVTKRPSLMNESIRIGDKLRYQQVLDNIAKADRGFWSFKELNRTEKKVREDEKETEKKTLNNSYKKHYEDLHGIRTIDLSNDELGKPKTISIDSDSDSDVKFVCQKKLPPVNSLKKRLEIEPVMNTKWISEWTDQYSRITEEKKKLIEEEKHRRDKFRDVNKANVQCRLEETLKSCLRLQDVILLDEEPEDDELKLPELTEEQERMVNTALKPGPDNQVFVEKFNLRITRADLQTLKGLNWLNDEVINFYTSLIAERGNGTNKKLPKVHAMNTFFYPKLISQGYSSLRRWTKRVDIFAQDMLIIPIHLGVHWCMAIVDFRDKTIKYYDAMGSDNPKCLKFLLEYLKQEHQDKKKSDYDTSKWKTSSVKDIPQQMNGSDCGMFACMFAEFLTRNAKILFTQEHMPYFRRKMVYEIISGQLLMK